MMTFLTPPQPYTVTILCFTIAAACQLTTAGLALWYHAKAERWRSLADRAARCLRWRAQLAPTIRELPLSDARTIVAPRYHAPKATVPATPVALRRVG